MKSTIVIFSTHPILAYILDKSKLLYGLFIYITIRAKSRKVCPNCKEKYINETNLEIFLLEFLEKHHDKISITDKLRAKIEKHHSITQTLLIHYKIKRKLDNPFIEYSRYIPTKGTENEMTNFSNGFKSKLSIKNGTLYIRKTNV